MLLERPYWHASDERRPQTRGECPDERPCPWLSCSMHLAIDVTPRGGLVARDISTLAETCALDVADQGGHTLEEVSELLGVTRQRVQQIEERATSRLRRSGAASVLR